MRDTVAPTAVLRAAGLDGRPLANNTLPPGTGFLLVGKGSADAPPGRVTKYRWTRLSGSGGSPALGALVETTADRLQVQAAPSPLGIGTHQFRLVVVDDAGNVSAPATVSVVVMGDTVAPTAMLRAAGLDGRPLANDTVPPGTGFLLVGKGSADPPPGRIVNYRWTRLSGSGGSLALGSPVATTADQLRVDAAPSPLALGTHQFRLVVVDDAGNVSPPATVSVAVMGDTAAPTAMLRVAGLDGRPLSNNTVDPVAGFLLVGKGSADTPPGRVARYRWTRLSGSGGSLALGSPVETTVDQMRVEAKPSPLTAGAHQFRLVVIDDAGNQSAPANVTVTVKAAPN